MQNSLHFLNSTIHQLKTGDYKNFVYLLFSHDTHEALIVDPQLDFSPWEQILAEQKATLKGCLLTHTHWDHVIGVPAILEKYNIPIYVHEADLKIWNGPHERLQFLKDGDTLNLGDLHIEVLHTPGHTAGGLTYCVRSPERCALITGDAVFVGQVGRTDLESGSTAVLFQTLSRLKSLALDQRYGPETLILPGHDYGATASSTLKQEMEQSAAFLCQTVAELEAVP